MSGWRAETSIPPAGGLRFRPRAASGPLSAGEVVRLWRESEAFRDWFGTLLASAPYPAFRWEVPALRAPADAPFEFVLLADPALDAPADPSAFAPHFAASAGDVVTFPNLAGDSLLVVPAPRGDRRHYGHLAAFVRGAPEGQRRAFWRAVGDAVAGRLGDRPLYLSTAGAGVPWLHARLDARPKYYRHAEYRDGGATGREG